MTSGTQRLEPSMRDEWTHPGVAWACALAVNAVRGQQLQMEVMFAWQATVAAFSGEIWDEWRCRFAGGVPIDG